MPFQQCDNFHKTLLENEPLTCLTCEGFGTVSASFGLPKRSLLGLRYKVKPNWDGTSKRLCWCCNGHGCHWDSNEIRDEGRKL